MEVARQPQGRKVITCRHVQSQGGDSARVRSVIEEGVHCQQQQPVAQMAREAVKGVFYREKRKSDTVDSLSDKRRERSGARSSERHRKAHAVDRGRPLEKRSWIYERKSSGSSQKELAKMQSEAEEARDVAMMSYWWDRRSIRGQ